MKYRKLLKIAALVLAVSVCAVLVLTSLNSAASTEGAAESALPEPDGVSSASKESGGNGSEVINDGAGLRSGQTPDSIPGQRMGGSGRRG